MGVEGGGAVKAEYGSMGALAGTLADHSEIGAGTGPGPTLTGNPQMDSALGDLETWLRICVSSLTTSASTVSGQVRTVIGRFHQADH